MNLYFKNLILFLIYFFILISFSTGFNFESTLYGTNLKLDWNDSYNFIMNTYAGGDQASYIMIGNRYLEKGFYLNTVWPPGLSIVHSLFIKFFGIEFQPIKIFYFLLIIMWASIFVGCTNLILLLRNKIFKIVGFLIIIFLLCSSTLNVFFLKQAIILSEGWATPLFLLGLLFLFQSLNKKKVESIIFASLFFFFAAIFRGVYDSFFSIITLLILASFIIYMLIKNVPLNKLYRNSSFKKKLPVFPLLSIVIIFNIFMFPIKSSYLFTHGEYSLMSNSENAMWAHNWRYDQELIDLGATWMVNGGATTPCKIDVVLCEEINDCGLDCYSNSTFKNFSLETIFKNPLEWLLIESKIAIFYWLDNPPLIASTSYVISEADKFSLSAVYKQLNYENFGYSLVLFLLCFQMLFMFISIVKNKKIESIVDSNYYNFLLISASALFALFLPQFLLHFEVRYFYPTKIVIVFVFIYGLLILDSKKYNKNY